MHEVGRICCQAVREDPQAKCGHLLWYYPFLSLCWIFISILVVFITLFFSPCTLPVLWYVLCRYRLTLTHTHTHMHTHMQTHQYTQKHIVTHHTEKESKKCTVLKPQMTILRGNVYFFFFWGNWLSFLFQRNIFTSLNRTV